jgi:hypothetical protein
MRYYLLLLLFTLGCAGLTHAQTTQRAELTVGFLDKSYSDFFHRNPNILSIDIDHTNMVTLKINKKVTDPNNAYKDIFVLTFEGDEYLFKKKYGEIKMPKVPNVDINYLNGVKDAELQKSFFKTYTIIKPDSIIHRYAYHTYQGDLDKPNQHSGDRQRPLLRSDFSKLKLAVDDSYKTFEKKLVKQTILMYSGIVDKKGKLNQLKLIEGKESQLSKRLMQTIEHEDTLWWPVMQGGRLSERSIRIFVNIKPNETLSLSIL